MLYEIAHLIKERLSFLWGIIEKGNSFLFTIRYKNKLRGIPFILSNISKDDITIRMTEFSDAKNLEKFFAEQPDSAFEFFKPHKFDEKSVLRILKNRAFITFVVTERKDIIGYFFLRSFVNGKCFKGRLVDYRQRNRGIAKLMGKAINEVAMHLNLRIFTTISPDNYASLASTKAVNDIKIVKTLDSGFYYIECTPKSSEV